MSTLNPISLSHPRLILCHHNGSHRHLSFSAYIYQLSRVISYTHTLFQVRKKEALLLCG